MRLLFLLLLALAGAPRAQPLDLRADDWCPHTCAPASGPASGDGYLVDLVRAALPQRTLVYRLDNWARLRTLTSAPPAPVLVVLGLGRSPLTTRDYRMTREPLGHSPFCFYARSGLNAWHYRGVESLRGLRLGVTAGYQFDDPTLQAYLNAPANARLVTRVRGAQPVQRHAEMLMAGRSDVVLEDREALRWVFRQFGAPERFREAGCLDDDTGLYVGVPRSDPRAAATLAALESGLQQLRLRGEMARIRARYGLKPLGAAR